MNKTNIEYLDYSWNPTHGCSPISPGCDQCWAKATAKSMARMGARGYSKDEPFKVVCCPWKLDEPLKVKKPSRIGVSFMGDLFHEDVPFDFIDQVFFKMLSTKRHNFLILTKRPERMRDYIETYKVPIATGNFQKDSDHIWLGVTAENQVEADKRIPILLQIPAAKRFVSIEPMLEAADISPYLEESGYESGGAQGWITTDTGLDWVIVGAESGPKRRPCELKWIWDIMHQCQDSGTPLFIKQIHCNGKVSKKPSEWPRDIRIQEFPS